MYAEPKGLKYFCYNFNNLNLNIKKPSQSLNNQYFILFFVV